MVNPDADPRYDQLWSHYHSLMERKGVSVDYAKREVRRRPPCSARCCSSSATPTG
jgi:malate dehydrogenase (oxaloacetate-decarboxylating)(NADP+)